MSEEQNVYVAHLTTIRKTWVAGLSEETKEKFKALEREERFKLYREIDDRIFEVANTYLYTSRENGEKVKIADAIPHAVNVVMKQYN